MNYVTPKILPGFMELLPNDQIEFDQIKSVIESTYKTYGFLPLDTPVIELSNVLLAKAGGETEKQIYRFNKGDNDLSLRFDLTVPLARYVSQHYNELTFPFKRYQIGKVYRGERPQKGRYREFYQCDIDVIGNDELPLIFDAEIPSIIYDIFKKLDFGKFTIKINNRKILNGFFESIGYGEQKADILRIIDKIDKIGQDLVIEELEKINIKEESINQIINFINIKGTTTQVMEGLKNLNIDNEIFNKGIFEMESLLVNIKSFNVPDDYYKIDLTIARGLDYYTGVIYETGLDEHPEVGSVCSGGKYENLTGYYSDKSLPGVGISIGLTRLYSKLKEVGLIKNVDKTNTKLLVIPYNNDCLDYSVKLASEFRSSNIATEVFYLDKKLNQKFKYADRANIPYVIVIGEDEIQTNSLTIKNMTNGEQTKCSTKEAIEKIKERK